ncbi:MAG TPA: hypothetical protein VF526_13840 [Solirubrobacteraceae bacterium]|jgi:hypothetical protein
MTGLHPEIRELIEAAAAHGVGMDDIEHGLLDPAQLPPDEHDALWLYAFGCCDFPNRRTIPIIAG